MEIQIDRPATGTVGFHLAVNLNEYLRSHPSTPVLAETLANIGNISKHELLHYRVKQQDILSAVKM